MRHPNGSVPVELSDVLFSFVDSLRNLGMNIEDLQLNQPGHNAKSSSHTGNSRQRSPRQPSVAVTRFLAGRLFYFHTCFIKALVDLSSMQTEADIFTQMPCIHLQTVFRKLCTSTHDDLRKYLPDFITLIAFSNFMLLTTDPQGYPWTHKTYSFDFAFYRDQHSFQLQDVVLKQIAHYKQLHHPLTSDASLSTPICSVRSQQKHQGGRNEIPHVQMQLEYEAPPTKI